MDFLLRFIDFIFPPSEAELVLRATNPQEFETRYRLNYNVAVKDDSVHSVFPYRNPQVRELIRQIKYKGNGHAVKCGGYALYKWIGCHLQAREIMLIPIPISRQRRKERGYNQCELLIDEVCRLESVGLVRSLKFSKNYNLLFRRLNITSQTKKGRDARLSSMKDIFDVDVSVMQKAFPQNTTILIIDDVYTTGATIGAAKNALINKGFMKILTLTLAH